MQADSYLERCTEFLFSQELVICCSPWHPSAVPWAGTLQVDSTPVSSFWGKKPQVVPIHPISQSHRLQVTHPFSFAVHYTQLYEQCPKSMWVSQHSVWHETESGPLGGTLKGWDFRGPLHSLFLSKKEAVGWDHLSKHWAVLAWGRGKVELLFLHVSIGLLSVLSTFGVLLLTWILGLSERYLGPYITVILVFLRGNQGRDFLFHHLAATIPTL